MTAGATSVVRRTHGIPGYTPETEQVATELAEKGVVVPSRRQAGTKYYKRSTTADRITEADEDRDEDEIEFEDEADEDRPARYRRRSRQIEVQPARRSRRRKQSRRVHWLLPLGVGMFIALLLYTLVYLGDLGLVKLTNNLRYGPNHISIFHGAIGEHDDSTHPTIFLGTLLHGSILVEEFPAGDQTHAKVFTFPPIATSAWGDINDIIVTVSPQTTGPTPNMLVKVEGDPQFDALLARPTVTFLLVHTGKGYKYGGVLQESS